MKIQKPKQVVSFTGTLRAMEVGDKCEFSRMSELTVRSSISRLHPLGQCFSARRDGDKLIVTRIK